MNNSNPPFYIGQKVVCVHPHTGPYASVKKGMVYTVFELVQCDNCMEWNVGVIKTGSIPKYSFKCCGERQPVGPYWFFSSYRFVPIENKYENITAEIAQSATQTEERPDRISIPETVNN